MMGSRTIGALKTAAARTGHAWTKKNLTCLKSNFRAVFVQCIYLRIIYPHVVFFILSLLLVLCGFIMSLVLSLSFTLPFSCPFTRPSFYSLSCSLSLWRSLHVHDCIHAIAYIFRDLREFRSCLLFVSNVAKSKFGTSGRL